MARPELMSVGGGASATSECNVTGDAAAPAAETPAAEASTANAPAAKDPVAEAPAAEDPAAGAPAAAAPAAETVAADTPAAEVPAADAPQAPAADVPAAGAPDAKVTVAEAPAAEAPGAETHAAETSQAKASASDDPAADATQTEAAPSDGSHPSGAEPATQPGASSRFDEWMTSARSRMLAKPETVAHPGGPSKSAEPAQQQAAPRPFADWVRDLKDFAEKSGNVYPSVEREKASSDLERSLGFWLGRVREKFQKGALETEQKKLLVSKVPLMQERFDRWEGVNDEPADPVELAAESGLGRVVLKALPPDAPKGHESFQKVRWREQQGIAVFQYPDATGVKVNFQTTRNASCGSQYAASRIARACYLRFEQKQSKDTILEFRATCYSRMQEAVAKEEERASSQKQKAGAAAGETSATPAKRRKVATADEDQGTPDVQTSEGTAPGSSTPAAAKPCIPSTPGARPKRIPEATASKTRRQGASETAGTGNCLGEVSDTAPLMDLTGADSGAKDVRKQLVSLGQSETEKKECGDMTLLQRTKEIFPAAASPSQDDARTLELYSMRAKEVLRILPKQAVFSAAPLHALRHVLESLAALHDGVPAAKCAGEEHDEAGASQAAEDELEDAPQPSTQQRPKGREAEIFAEIVATTPESKVGDKDRELLPRVLATFSKYMNEALASSTKQCTRDNYMRLFFKAFLQSGLSFDGLAQPSLLGLLTKSDEHRKAHGNTAIVVRNFSQFWRENGGYAGSFVDADRESLTLSLNIRPVLVDTHAFCGAGAHAGCFCQRPKQRCETCGVELRCPRHEEKHTQAECREIFWAKHSPSGKRSRTIADLWKARASAAESEH